MPRSLLDVLNTPGYVSLIEGQPGTGKTSLALKACAARGKCTYISYADPEQSINAKLKALGHDGKIRVVNMMTGRVERAFSEIESSLSRNELVVVDSIDAMFYSVRDESEIRSFLQLLYGSVKGKGASLAMISEGLNPVAQQIRFVSDAIISMAYREILGKPAREAVLLKDRDYSIENSSFFITLEYGLKIVEPTLTDVGKKPRDVKLIVGPPETSFKYILSRSYKVLTAMNISVHPAIAETIRQWVAADFLKVGYGVNLVISPISSEKSEREALGAMAGNSLERLNIISIVDPDVRKDAARYYKAYRELMKDGNRYVTVVDLLAHESLAITDPAGYELFISSMSELGSMPVIFYGYQDYFSLKTVSKYVHMQWSTEVVNGTLFYLTIKPNGPLYYIDADIGSGRAEFRRML